MHQFVLTDAQWAKIEPLCLGKRTDPGRSGRDNRLFLEAVLWIARTGSPWRDLPSTFGNWNTVFVAAFQSIHGRLTQAVWRRAGAQFRQPSQPAGRYARGGCRPIGRARAFEPKFL